VKIYYDLNTDQLIEQPGVGNPITMLQFKRTLLTTLDVQFVRDSAVVELPSGATGIFGLKPLGKYDADYSVAALSWVKSGSGSDAVYTFLLSFINAELNDLFHVDSNLTNDVVSIDFMAELQWTFDGLPHKSQTITVTIFNDVNRGGEDIPITPGTIPSDVDTAEVVASEDLPALCLVTAGGEIADSNNLFHFNHVLGILMTPVAADNVATIVVEGEVTDLTWSWTANQKLFLNGTSISTVPPSAGFSQLVGITRNSHTIFIRLQVPIKL
jgi:hypothetical protein